MPIGKNSIKRVANNGYSNVKTSAPDMENSTVPAEAPSASPSAAPKKTAPKKAGASAAKTGAKKTAGARSTVKAAASSAPSTGKKSVKPVPVSNNDKTLESKPYFNIGDDIPVYLL